MAKWVSANVICVVLFSILLTWKFTESDDDHWRYFGIYGVSNWSAVYQDCDAANHTRQSPVNIVVGSTEPGPGLTEIGFKVTMVPNDVVIIINNGHTVSFNWNQSAVLVEGGHLNGTFRVGGIHFHWGSKDDAGSEHTIDGKHFPMEMHIVTYDASRYSGVIDASHGTNSIAVLGVFFTISKDNNTILNPIVSQLRLVTKAGQPANFSYFDPQTLLPENKQLYYRYLGSLTTPPCSESVIWSVFDNALPISLSQMSEFRKLQELMEDDGTIDYLSNNWRPTQPLYNRKVQRSIAFESSNAVKNMLQMTSLVILILLQSLVC